MKDLLEKYEDNDEEEKGERIRRANSADIKLAMTGHTSDTLTSPKCNHQFQNIQNNSSI